MKVNSIYSFLTSVLLLVTLSVGHAQITGASSVTVGSTVTYNCPDMYSEEYPTGLYWQATNGTIIGSNQNPLTVTVQWSSSAGTGTIALRINSTTLTSKTVTITSSTPNLPAAPPTPTIVYECAQGRLRFNGTPPAGVTWYWQTVPSGTDMSNSSSEWVVSNNGYFYFLRARNSSGWSGSSSVLFDTDPTIPAAPVTTSADRCQAGQLTLYTNSASNRWFTTPYGGTPFYTGSSYTATFSSTTTYYVEAITPYNCVSARTPVTATIYPAAAAGNLTLTTVAAFCFNGVATFSQSGHAGNVTQWLTRYRDGEGSWSSWQVYSIANSSANSYGVSASSVVRVYEFYNTIQSGSCPVLNTNTVSVTVNPLPLTANAGPDQTGASSCAKTSVTLAGNAPGAGMTGQWSIVSGSGIAYFANPESLTSDNPTAVFNGRLGQTYTLRWTISSGACGSTYDDMVVKFTSNPTVANAGTDMTGAETCGVTSVTLAGNTPVIGTGRWSIIGDPDGFSFGDTASPNSTFSGLPGSTYTVYWTISNSPCPSSTDAVTIKFNQPASAAHAGADITGAATCGLTSVALSANSPAVGTGSWSIVNGSGGSFANASNPASVFNGTSGATYNLRWTVSNAPCSASTDDVSVTFNETPVPPVVSGNSRFGTGAVTLMASGGSNYHWYDGSNALVGTGSTYVTGTIASSVSNYAYVKSVGTICNSTATVVSIHIEPLPVITASGNRVAHGSSVQLSGAMGYSSYAWLNSIGTTVGTQQNFEVTTPGNYSLRVTKTGVSGTGTSERFNVFGQLEGVNKNYILTNVPQHEVSDQNNLLLLPIESVSQSIQYFDGLGRLEQSISIQGSPGKLDVVVPTAYDDFGREVKKYLPYVPDSREGHFQPQALTDQSSFYATGRTTILADAKPYSETVLEASPLNRVLKQGAVGEAWQPNDAGNDKVIRKKYEFNTDMDKIYLFRISSSGELILDPVVQYVKNTLYANKTYDEGGNAVIEYVDKEGRTICKKVQSGGAAASPEFASTYYVYDDFGNLAVVLPPEGVKALLSSLNQN